MERTENGAQRAAKGTYGDCIDVRTGTKGQEKGRRLQPGNSKNRAGRTAAVETPPTPHQESRLSRRLVPALSHHTAQPVGFCRNWFSVLEWRPY